MSSVRPAERLKDLTPEEVADFFQTVIKVQKVMEAVHSSTSSTICVQDGVDAGQTVHVSGKDVALVLCSMFIRWCTLIYQNVKFKRKFENNFFNISSQFVQLMTLNLIIKMYYIFINLF